MASDKESYSLVDVTEICVVSQRLGREPEQVILRGHDCAYVLRLIQTHTRKPIEQKDATSLLRFRIGGYTYDGHFLEIRIPSQKGGVFDVNLSRSEFDELMDFLRRS